MCVEEGGSNRFFPPLHSTLFHFAILPQGIKDGKP
jgi:hypothetical protein